MNLPFHLMTTYGLTDQGWSLGFHKESSPIGRCDYKNRLITVSESWVPYLDADELDKIVLHEIGHAKTGQGNAHNAQWRATMLSMGVEPTVRLKPRKTPSNGSYAARCSNCGSGSEHPIAPRTPLYCRHCLTDVGPQGSLLKWTTGGKPVRHSPLYWQQTKQAISVWQQGK